MTKGKPWPIEDERKLKDWFTSGTTDIGVLAFSFGNEYTEQAVRLKLMRLGLLKEEEGRLEIAPRPSSSKLEWPNELPSVEETLKTLAAALEALQAPGLKRDDILRLRGIISGAKIYQELIANYINYRALEAELLEWRNKFEELAKKSQES